MFRSPSPSDRKHLAQCGLSVKNIGRWRGSGAGHDVYEYGDTQVVKIPKIRWIKERLSIITAEDAQNNLTIISTHFREYSLHSCVYSSMKGSSYCLLQQKLESFENLTSAHLRANRHLAEQLNDILCRNKQLAENNGVSLDFLGKEGCIQTALSPVFFGTPQMANLVVVGHGISAQIIIVDSNVFSLSRKGEKLLSRKLMNDATKCGHTLNKLIVNKSFGSHISAKAKS